MNIKDLKHNPKNPRKISDAKLNSLKVSLLKFGDLSGFVVNRRSGNLISGHQRQKALPPDSAIKIDKKWEEPTRSKTVAEGHVVIEGERFKYREVDCDETWEAEAMLAANKHGGEWDTDILKRLLLETPNINIEVTGFELPEIQALDIQVPTFDPEKVEPEPIRESKEEEKPTPEPPKNPKVRLGDLWELGGHKLYCGNSTIQQHVDTLMKGEKADLIFTDPPYNLGSDSKSYAAASEKSYLGRKNFQKLKNSEWDYDFSFEKTFPIFEFILAENSTIYVCTSHFLFGSIQEWMKKWGDISHYIVWSKPNPMPSLAKRHWTWSSELICYATRGKHVFNFPNNGHAPSVWNFNKNQANTLHPTQKPVEIPTHAILHSSEKGQLIVDLFGGSGSTLIACENTGRKCFTMEIDPAYCDVILERWANHTKKDPVRDDGTKWSSLTR